MKHITTAFICIIVAFWVWVTLFLTLPAFGHEIYTNLRDAYSTLCCGGNDCEPTQVRVEPGGASFYSERHKRWIFVPTAMITYDVVPGDKTGADGHWCGFLRIQQGPKPPINGPDFQLGTFCAFVSVGGS